ncbi:MAG: DUF438 domain-containing protein [Spirochaetes bacterium]|nr:DUF438 domain-containing protein [Spirochaetota bacterium]
MPIPQLTDAAKQEELKAIIKDLHSGVAFAQVKKRFDTMVRNVSAEEIAAMEQALIAEGVRPEEIQKLCEVHVAVFQQSLKKQKSAAKLPGHPVNTFIAENKAAKTRIDRVKRLVSNTVKERTRAKTLPEFKAALDDLRTIIVHYTRKENQLFPMLEAKGFTGPSKVMWGKHDEVRAMFKDIDRILEQGAWNELKGAVGKLTGAIGTLMFMEERILFPTSLKKLSEKDWIAIRNGEGSIGFAWITPGSVWEPGVASMQSAPAAAPSADSLKMEGISLDTGVLTPEYINLMLKNLPLDVTYVDENDTVRYYTDSAERVFPRSPAVIGRKVQNCHPHKSVHIVEKILGSFRAKTKTSAEFWITMGGKFLHIRYFAIYDKNGTYAGCLEVTQDVTGIRALSGEKRLLDWE